MRLPEPNRLNRHPKDPPVYVVVNTGLVLIDLAQGDGLQWAHWVMIGWGIGLVAHGASIVIFESQPASRWEARKLAEFTEQEEHNLGES